MRLTLSPLNPNTRETYEDEYREGGLYDQQRGSRQTQLFARYFHQQFTVPLTGNFTVLDMGCALGDALPAWRRKYPEARLLGCDVAPSAIRRAEAKFGHLASFFVGGFEELNSHYDVIYCSNVLEHFEQYPGIAAHLLQHCRLLYIMTPYNELKERSPMQLRPGAFHVASFYQNSFDFLREGGLAQAIRTRVFRCPGAWSWTCKYRCYRLLQSALLGKPIEQEPLQIAYEIVAA